LLFDPLRADTLLYKAVNSGAIHLAAPSPHSRLDAAAQWPLPVCVLAAGMLGVLDRSPLGPYPSSRIAFALLLLMFVVVRFHRRMQLVPQPLAADIRRVSRHLSRMIYLLLGLLVAFEQLTGAGHHDLRDYLAYALGALVLVRILALLYLRAARRRAARARETAASRGRSLLGQP